MKKIRNIQMLRGIACLFVVYCHTAVGNGIGKYGVDIFLIISGFIMMHTTEFDTDQFLWKRIKKIIPLYWLITLFTSFAVYVAPQLFNSYEVSLEYILKSLFFIPYEHNGIRQPVLGLGWTLNYEMIFYFIFGIAIKIDYKRRGIIASIICFIMVLTNMIFKLPMPFDFWCDSFILEFCYGIGIYCIWNGLYKIYMREGGGGRFLGQTILMYAVIIIGYMCMEFLARSSIHRVIGTGIIGAIIVSTGIFLEGKVYVPKILLLVGELSYVIYLTHIYLVRLTETLIGRFVDVKSIVVAIDILSSVIVAYLYVKFKKMFEIYKRNRLTQSAQP